MLDPLKQFICDTCGQIIEKPEDGWFEWLEYYDETRKKSIAKKFRICHHEDKCQKLGDHIYCSDNSLKYFVGEWSQIQLLRLIDIGPYHEKDYSQPMVEDFREFAEISRRLTIPYYEEARLYWRQAVNDGYFNGINEVSIYLPDTLKGLIEEYQLE